MQVGWNVTCRAPFCQSMIMKTEQDLQDSQDAQNQEKTFGERKPNPETLGHREDPAQG